MAHPFHHSLSSVRKWGGKVEDYLPLHNWFDESKKCLADFRHRALRHHAEGIFWAEEVFGVTLTNADGKIVPVRWVGEQHVKEDLGWIPTLQDWFKHLRIEPWMAKTGNRQLGRGELPPLPLADASASDQATPVAHDSAPSSESLAD